MSRDNKFHKDYVNFMECIIEKIFAEMVPELNRWKNMVLTSSWGISPEKSK